MKRITTGTDHSGKSNAFARPGEPALAVHHDPNEARKGDVGIAPKFMKPAAKKVMHPVSLHNSATEQQKALTGMGHAMGSAPDANPANPVSKEPNRKTFAPVAVSPGMRSRGPQPHDAALGVAILNEALKN
jgi:hypothetical protein